MDVGKLKIDLMKCLTEERYEHVLRVAETAKKLAERFAIPVEKAEQAALFHDIAKCMDKSELHQILEREKEDSRLFPFHHELWHAPVGAIIARDEFGICRCRYFKCNPLSYNGRAGMSALEKLIYIADMIEPGRSFPGVEILREKAARKSRYSNGSLHLSVSAVSCE